MLYSEYLWPVKKPKQPKLELPKHTSVVMDKQIVIYAYNGVLVSKIYYNRNFISELLVDSWNIL
jgi:hypothetical protein